MAAVAAIADTTASVNNEEQLVTMVVDKQLFGIPILQVQDIVEASKVTAVPLSPSAIGGMLNLRGRIVTVIDLRKLLGNDEEIAADSQMGVTVEHKGDLYTLLVDSIGDVRSVRRSDFDKAPSTLEPETRRLCSGIYRLKGSLLVVLDVSRILTSEVIGSTSVLTVAERKARKASALEAAKGEESDVRQVTSQLTGLGGFDAESENADSDQSSDNIKQRKKENRSRRPIADRWREVMEERARQSGQTVYRVREPDDETLESAQEQMAAEEEAWLVKSKGGAGPDTNVPDGSAGDLGVVPDEAFSDEPASTEFVPDEMLSDEPFSDEPIASEPVDSAEPTPADAVQHGADESATDAAPAADPDEALATDSSDATEDQPTVEPAPVAGESAAADVEDMKSDEPAPDAVLDPANDVPEAGDAPAHAGGDSAEGGKHGMLSGLWSKLRSADMATADEPSVFDEIPASDEAPVADDAPVADEVPVADDAVVSGDEPIADDEPVAKDEPVVKDKPKKAKKAAKSAKNAKSAAKKKAPAKRKAAKSGDS